MWHQRLDSGTPAANPSPVSQTSLVAGSKSENSLVIYGNAASQQLKLFTDAFRRRTRGSRSRPTTRTTR
jgi:hypothetical protein